MGCSVEHYRARIGLFVNTLQKILTRKAKFASAKIRGLRVDKLSGKLAVACLFLMLVMGCVERNPGPPSPPPPSASNNIPQSLTTEAESAQWLQGLSEAVQSLSSGMKRLEEGQQQLAQSLDQKLGTLQSTLNDKLNHLEGQQEVLRLDLDELCDKQERVEEDTAALKETVQELTSKFERLDAERRKPNLLFFGVANRAGATCEQLIKEVFQEKLNITADIMIEYAYWTGNAILVRFQSLKQRDLVLTHARKLPASSRLSIREDFSKEVSSRRKGLIAFYKELRSDGRRATLRADRLYTNDGIYTFNTQRQEIVRIGEPSSQQRHQQPQNGNTGAWGSDGAAASVHHTNRNTTGKTGDRTRPTDASMQITDAESDMGGSVRGPLAPSHCNPTGPQKQKLPALGKGQHSHKHLAPWTFPKPHSQPLQLPTGQGQPSPQQKKQEGNQASQSSQEGVGADQLQSDQVNAPYTVQSTLSHDTETNNNAHTQQHNSEQHSKN